MPADRQRILIANRGEIAMRIARACRDLGHDFICVVTHQDHASGHAELARELGGLVFRVSSYHDANELLSVADASGATALHPGYGFFAEDYRFARRVVTRDRPLVFIGPSWWLIRDLGDKISTKRLARGLEVPTIPGSDRPIYSEIEAEEVAESLFAFQAEQGIEHALVLVKASAGGGGMGIEEVGDPALFRGAFRRIRNYAKRHFLDEGVLIEQRIFDFNHIEVQVVAARGGAEVVHYGTRNCSIQSSGHQKRIEVAPGFCPAERTYSFAAAAVLDDVVRHSLAMARHVSYDNVGTFEWIVTPKGDPFLMEVNTRIQVENGVSTAIARVRGRGGMDLVAEQIRLALGDPLGYAQEDITFEGVGIEYRIVAENPADRFKPWLGSIHRFSYPSHPWLQVFTQVPKAMPYEIPTDYDPNLALAIVWGNTLAEAMERGRAFLGQVVLEGRDARGGGMQHNVAYLLEKTGDALRFEHG